MQNEHQLILASSSPRRKDILSTLGYKFKILTSDVCEELPSGIAPSDGVALLAERKALAVAAAAEQGAVVLGADTVVALDNKILGKPESPSAAKRMLSSLSDRTHSVYTGICAVCGGRIRSSVCRTDVVFRKISSSEIDWYVSTGEPLDKAGGYGIQGRGCLFVKGIEGDYFNVVGLPASRTAEILSEFNIKLF